MILVYECDIGLAFVGYDLARGDYPIVMLALLACSQ